MPDRRKTQDKPKAALRPFYSVLPEDFLDPKLLLRLGHARCLAWQCLPICEDDAGVTIATSQEAAIPELTVQMAKYFEKKIIWVLCSEPYLDAAIQRAFGYYTR